MASEFAQVRIQGSNEGMHARMPARRVTDASEWNVSCQDGGKGACAAKPGH